MRFRDFEIRKHKDFNGNESDNYELIKWQKAESGKEYCFVLAFIRWNKKEPCWEFDGVGMRFIEYYEDGLCEYIKAFMNLIDVIEDRGDD